MGTVHYHNESGDTLDDYDLEQLYREMLDECYSDLTIAGLSYDTSRALETVDPVAYRCGLADYSSEFEECFGGPDCPNDN